MTEHGAGAITSAIRVANGPAVCAYVTAGYPDLDTFPRVLESVAAHADLVEVGVPFTDPMADGLTIQRASHVALNQGVTLSWILELLEDRPPGPPILLMGYYNPFHVFGPERLGEALDRAAVSGVIVPDLPYEESDRLGSVLERRGQGLVQLVTPTTPFPRLQKLAGASGGFVYAVTTRGVTGGNVELGEADLQYLARVREASSVPVLAGFGIRHRSQIESLAPFVDGVVVGSALIDVIEDGGDPGSFLDSLRPRGDVS